MRPLTLLLFLVVVSGVGAQPTWRLSDALGNDLGPVPGSRTKGWVLRIEPRGGQEERTLFRNGREDSLRLIDRDSSGHILRWRDMREGMVVWETSFDPQTGLPSEETAFEKNRPSEVSQLTFRDRTLVGRIVRDPGGALLYQDRLLYWPDGTLRRIERDGPEGPLSEVSWTYGAGGRLSGVWVVDEEARSKKEHREWIYSDGHTEDLLATETAVLVSRITEQLEAGGTKETRTEVASDRKETRILDAQGRLIEETVAGKGLRLQTRRWKYDDQGRILETYEDSAGPQEVWTYVYQPGGLVESTLTRDGVRVREETVRDGEKVSVRLFDRGQLFLVETWDQGKRVKETYYLKGSVVRERTP